jgi:hypothetical protein
MGLYGCAAGWADGSNSRGAAHFVFQSIIFGKGLMEVAQVQSQNLLLCNSSRVGEIGDGSGIMYYISLRQIMSELIRIGQLLRRRRCR